MAATAVLFPPELDLLPLGTAQDHILNFGREVFERGADVEFVGLGQGVQGKVVPAGEPLFPGDDRPFTDGELRIGDDQIGIEVHPGAETGAVGTGAVGVVEGEHPRGHLRVGDGAVDAGKGFGEEGGLAVDDLHLGDPLGMVQRRFKGVGQPPLDPLLGDQPVNDNIDVVLLVLVQRDLFGQFIAGSRR